jgi:chorismate dehydratase
MIHGSTNSAADSASPARIYRVGAVRFLNARPLVFGLDRRADVQLSMDVPAGLGDALDAGRLDAAMVPAIDCLRAGPRWTILSAGCIASDDETLTVRIFSRVPLDRIDRLAADGDSHTSVALARLVLGRSFNRNVQIETADMRAVLALPPAERPDSVLLIGDKVVAARPNDPASPWPIQLDLGCAWRKLTGLPFVFAVWAANRAGQWSQLAAILDEARLAGVARLEQIARADGPPLGWPIELAIAYLTRHLAYELTPHRREGLERFFEFVGQDGVA